MVLTDVLPPPTAPAQAGGYVHLPGFFEGEEEGGPVPGTAPTPSGLSLGGFPRAQMDALSSLLEEHVGRGGEECAASFLFHQD